MTFWTHIQRCSDESYHIGQSEDLDQPIAEHQSGAIKACASERLPVELVWSQDFPTRARALAAELKIESWSRAHKYPELSGGEARVGTPKRAAYPCLGCDRPSPSTAPEGERMEM